MAQLTIPAEDFSLKTTWTCRIVYTYDSTGAFNSSTAYDINYSMGEKTIGFTDENLVDVTIKSVKVYAQHSTGTFGGSLKIDGVILGNEGFVTLTNPDFSNNTINVTFSWDAATDNSNAHDSEHPTYNGTSSQTAYKDHWSVSNITTVYAIVDYEPNYIPPDLLDYTDPEPIQGETYVKAIHMTELHTNVNLVRIARKLAGYEFTPIIAMETGLAGWNSHVLEIRNAVDEIGIAHEDWITIDDVHNYPRLDVLLQLRRVVKAVVEA